MVEATVHVVMYGPAVGLLGSEDENVAMFVLFHGYCIASE